MKRFGTIFLIGIVILFSVANLFAQWEPDVRLTYDDSTSFTSYTNAWCVAAHENTVHIVWYDNRDGNYDIFYKRSPDGGITWGNDTLLTDSPTWSQTPSVSSSNSNVHVVWADDRFTNFQIFYKHSVDEGITWKDDTMLTNNSAYSLDPSIAVSGSNVHIVWMDYYAGNYEIYYKRSINGGISWEEKVVLTSDTSWSEGPSIAVSGSNVHTVWFDGRINESFGEIYYKRSTDDGTTWEQDIRLTYDSLHSQSPSIVVSNSNVHVVWSDTRSLNFDIFYKRSTDNGTTWGTDTILSNNSSFSGSPSLAASDNNLHVVWMDTRDGNYEIYYKSSTNNGTTWGIDTRLTNAILDSWRPSVAIADSIIHVVWYDERDGNSEIYYKRNPTGNPGIEEKVDLKYKITDLRLICHPNPFTTEFSVKCSGIQKFNSQLPNSSTPQLTIYDISGRLVKSVPLTTNHLLLGTDLLPGIYFLKLNGKHVGKVVKVR